MSNKKSLFTVSVIHLALVIALNSISVIASVEKKDSVTFGIVLWSESLAIVSLLTHILRVDLGLNVNTMNPNIGTARTASSQGDLDLFVEVWLPLTQEAYWEKFAADVTDFSYS